MSEAVANNKLGSMNEDVFAEEDTTVRGEVAAEVTEVSDEALSDAEMDSLLDSMDDLEADLDGEFDRLLDEESSSGTVGEVEDISGDLDPLSVVGEVAEDDLLDEEGQITEAVTEVLDKTMDEAEPEAPPATKGEESVAEEEARIDQWENAEKAEDLFDAPAESVEAQVPQDGDAGLPGSMDTVSSSSDPDPVSPPPEEKSAPETASVIPLHQASEEEGEPVLGVPDIPAGTADGGAKSVGVIGFVAVVVSMIALTFGAFGMWMINSLDAEVKELRTAVVDVTAEANADTLDSAQMKTAISAIGLINARLDEMGLQIAGLRSDAVKRQIDFEESVKARVQKIGDRVDALEAVKAPARVAERKTAVTSQREKKAPSDAGSSKPKASVTATPTAKKGAGWVVNLGAFSRSAQAEKVKRRLQKKGVKASVFPVRKAGRLLYRVGVDGFESAEKARVYARSLRKMTAIPGAWVGKAGY